MNNRTDRFNISQRGGLVDGMPVTPLVNIVIETEIRSQNGEINLTPDLSSDGEIDHWVKCLKDDLDYMGKLAKLALEERKAEISN